MQSSKSLPSSHQGDVLAHSLQRLRQSGDDNHRVLVGVHQKGSITRLGAQASHRVRKTQFSVGTDRPDVHVVYRLPVLYDLMPRFFPLP